ncbi:unnamed protein product [Brachionus calyciflorus]|uniref:Nucleoplasmin core domain-containing protein n=1 Tax=Brachionus calyciflorus TaxID=104777 RepID=A0A813MC72_9BILA|nr:unnamed protein product [Brachionus calyciflorus]
MASQKLLWVCELNKDQPSKLWKAADGLDLEDEDDTDFVINSLVLKTAVLGADAVENERNLVAVKAKGTQDKDFEQPIFSLTLGRNDVISGMDLTLASDHNTEIEFKLVKGTGPVFITCNHVIEMPVPEEQTTIMTASDGELEESVDEVEEEMEEEEEEEEEKPKGKGKKNGTANGKANGKNGKAVNGKNGHTNGTNGKAEEEAEVDEKPNKRRRN